MPSSSAALPLINDRPSIDLTRGCRVESRDADGMRSPARLGLAPIRTVTIPYAFGKDEETGRVRNFEQAAAALAGRSLADKQLPGYPFDDTDVYKVIEGAAYTLSVRRDATLEAYVDALVEKIRAAQ